mmetsp:Transcript_7600/g.12056  ORF Transcript_7600/g.12056 Transcript_7600/m.12056 type:complete len:207 (-) Transcript_7600:618-1238(-)
MISPAKESDSWPRTPHKKQPPCCVSSGYELHLDVHNLGSTSLRHLVHRAHWDIDDPDRLLRLLASPVLGRGGANSAVKGPGGAAAIAVDRARVDVLVYTVLAISAPRVASDALSRVLSEGVIVVVLRQSIPDGSGPELGLLLHHPRHELLWPLGEVLACYAILLTVTICGRHWQLIFLSGCSLGVVPTLQSIGPLGPHPQPLTVLS